MNLDLKGCVMKIEQFVGLAKGYFNDNLYTGDQVNPQSIDKIEEIIKDLDITLDMVNSTVGCSLF